MANAERRDKVVLRLHPGPLRGRSEPVALALGALRSAVHHGSSTLLMVSGAPGIGKTAMLGEVCRQAARMQPRVASGRCEPIRQVSPGAPVIAALRTGRSSLADAGVRADRGASRPAAPWGSLTDAERRVAALIADGRTNRSAATELGLSVNTIGTHLRLVFTKLGIQSRVQLANTLNAQGQLTQD